MKPRQSFLKTLFSAAGLFLAVLAWFYLAPIPFGGRAAYVIVTGNSMEPRFHRGDLVVLQQAAGYAVGDIAVYRHPQVGPIIHRIVDRDGPRFVFKGDNNDWLDSYRPEAAELTGKFWLHLPAAGRVVEQLRAPWALALLAAVTGVVGLTVVAGSRAGKPKRQLTETGQSPMSHSLYASRTDLFSVLIAAGLASLVLAVVAFTRPVLQTTSENIPYQQAGVFRYETDAPPGIYESDRVRTGEPVFRQLITRVDLRFDYEFSAEAPAGLSGTYRLLAQLGHDNGWKRTLELQPETKFEGPAFTIHSRLDLAELQALIDSLEQQTGLYNQPYTLQIQPRVTLTGSLAGLPIQEKFSPALVFALDPLQMRVAAERGSGDPFFPSQSGLLQQPVTAPNTITLLGFQLNVLAGRRLALAGLVLSLGGCAALGWTVLQAGRADEPARIQLKYGPLLVAVHDSSPRPQAGAIEVATIADLAKIAEREGRMILYQDNGHTCHYRVQSGEVSYNYPCCRQAAAAKEEARAGAKHLPVD